MNWQVDFLLPAIDGLPVEKAKQVALALDTAILFSGIHALYGELDKLGMDMPLETLEAIYQEKVARLKGEKFN